MSVVFQRQADLDGSSDLKLLAAGVQLNADGRYRLQLDASEHWRDFSRISNL